MRNDMYKVIVERPRSWKGGDRSAVQRRDDLDGPMHLGMRAGYAGRFLNENLAPLRRYLRAQVGRPWNKVRSEISAGIDRRNTVQQHIYQHIDDFIAIDVDIRDGRLVDLRSPDRYGTRFRGLSQELYVDPHSGLIRVNKEYRAWRDRIDEQREQEQAQLIARRRILNDRTVLLRLDDLWFEVTLAQLPPDRVVEREIGGERKRKVVVERRYDIVLRREVSRYDESVERERVYGSRELYAVSKRQLSKREMKAHGLRE
jgi:hypothetical protein